MDLFQRPNTLLQTELAFNLQCSSWIWFSIRDIFRTTIHFKTLLHASAWLQYEQDVIESLAKLVRLMLIHLLFLAKSNHLQVNVKLPFKGRNFTLFQSIPCNRTLIMVLESGLFFYPIFESSMPWWMQSTHLQCFREASVVIGISTDSVSHFF